MDILVLQYQTLLMLSKLLVRRVIVMLWVYCLSFNLLIFYFIFIFLIPRAAAVGLAKRHADGSLPVEDFNIELENQSGRQVQLGTETDQRYDTQLGFPPNTC